jgi:hypothetical protein
MTAEDRNSRKGNEETTMMDPDGDIARKLRAVYREVESQEIPQQFLDLLEKLDAAEKSQNGGGNG